MDFGALLRYGETATLNVAPPLPQPRDMKDMGPICARWPLLLKYDPETGLLLRRYVLLSGMNPHPLQYTASRRAVVGNRARNRVSVDGFRVDAANIVWLLHHGAWPERRLKRRDGDDLNDRIENLALDDLPADARQRRRPQGVARYRNRWQAYAILPDGRQKNLGVHDTEAEAVAARKVWDDAQDLV